MKLAYDVIDPEVTTTKLSPIIFLHGLFDWRKTWYKVAPEIVKRTGRKAYLPDTRNHGSSPRHPTMDIEVMTQDLVNFMDRLNIQRAVLVAHSVGGRTAINFAFKYPWRLELLVVEDMTPKNIYYGSETLINTLLVGVSEYLSSLPAEMDLDTAKKTVLDLLISIAGTRFASKDRLLKHIDVRLVPIKKVGDKFTSECHLEAASSFLGSDALVQNLPDKGVKFEGDTLFVYGSKGWYKLEKDSSINKLFPKAVRKKVDDACHFVHWDSQDEFVEIVTNFILYRHLNRSKY